MIKIGVRAHDLGARTPETLAPSVRAAGFDTLQFIMHKALGREGYTTVYSDAELDELGASFARENFTPLILGCYRDFGNPALHDEVRAEFTRYIGYAARLGIPYIATETALNALPPEECVARRGYLVDFAAEMAEVAQKQGVKLLLEMVKDHPFNAPEVCQAVIARLGEAANFIFDPSNLLFPGPNPAEEQRALYASYLAEADIAAHVKVVHLKDLVFAGEERNMLPLGEGLINYADLGALLARCPLEGLIREWERPEWVRSDLTFMRELRDRLS